MAEKYVWNKAGTEKHKVGKFTSFRILNRTMKYGDQEVWGVAGDKESIHLFTGTSLECAGFIDRITRKD